MYFGSSFWKYIYKKNLLPGIERLIRSWFRESFSMLLSTSRVRVTVFGSTNDIDKNTKTVNANDIISQKKANNRFQQFENEHKIVAC